MLVCSTLLGACASGGRGGRPQAPDPDAIAKLETQQKLKTNSADVMRALGIAYYKAGRIPEARQTLEKARELNPKDGTTALYSGLAAEQAGDLTAARDAYSSYLTFGKTQRVRSQLQARLASISRMELEQSAKVALANEAQLAATPGDPRTVAVLPLRFSGTDSSLIPLERGIADLLVTDLSRSKALTIVERERMQAIYDELKLAQSGQTEATTAVRAGKLIRAGRIVQGSITQLPSASLRIDAAVVDASTSQATGSASGDDRLEEIFSLEKKIALNLFDAMGITLSDAERKLIEERPTKSLAAFLAYSSGLMAQDAGNFEDARRYYQDAVRADPGFRGAAQRSQQVQQISTAQTTTTAQVESQLSGSTEEKVVQAAQQGVASGATETQSLSGTAQQTAESLNPSSNANALNSSQTSQLSAPPVTQTAAQSTGTTNPGSQPGSISITVNQPKP
jgi:tetratricopeptide (TPR) repeat protein